MKCSNCRDGPGWINLTTPCALMSSSILNFHRDLFDKEVRSGAPLLLIGGGARQNTQIVGTSGSNGHFLCFHSDTCGVYPGAISPCWGGTQILAISACVWDENFSFYLTSICNNADHMRHLLLNFVCANSQAYKFKPHNNTVHMKSETLCVFYGGALKIWSCACDLQTTWLFICVYIKWIYSSDET